MLNTVFFFYWAHIRLLVSQAGSDLHVFTKYHQLCVNVRLIRQPY